MGCTGECWPSAVAVWTSLHSVLYCHNLGPIFPSTALALRKIVVISHSGQKMSVPYVCVQKEMALVGFSFYNNCRLFHPQNVYQCHIEHIILQCVSNIPVIKMGDNNNSNCYFHSNNIHTNCFCFFYQWKI